MRIREWGLIALASTAIAVGAGIVTARILSGSPKTEAPTPPLPALYIPEDKADLGEVWETNDAVLTVPICNSTDRDIEILDFETSCDCGEVSPRKLTVPAKGTATVQVKMDLTRRTPQQIGMVRRKFSLAVRPVVGERKQPQLTVHCIARSVITVNRIDLDFGESNRVGTPAISRRLIVESHSPYATLVVKSTLTQLQFRQVKLDQSRIELEMIPIPAIGSRKGETTVVLCAMQGDGACLSRVPIEVTGILIDTPGVGK